MKLPEPMMTLFDLSVDALAADLPPADARDWDLLNFRAKMYSDHAATRSIMLRWLANDWEPNTVPSIQTITIPRPYAQAVLDVAERLRAHFGGGTIAKLMLAELPPGGAIPPHRDTAAALVLAHRCHVPILTNHAVDFRVEGVNHTLVPGTAYEFDNTLRHSVANRGETRRIHLICDILPEAHTTP